MVLRQFKELSGFSWVLELEKNPKIKTVSECPPGHPENI
jgi:hypothetical protein